MADVVLGFDFVEPYVVKIFDFYCILLFLASKSAVSYLAFAMSHFAPKEIKGWHSGFLLLLTSTECIHRHQTHIRAPAYQMYEQNLWGRVVLPDVESHKTQQDYQAPFEV